MKFRKYEFTPSQWSTQKKKIEKTDEKGNTYFDQDICASVIELGFLVITPGEYDADGNVIKDPVLSSKYSVDIIWQDDEISTFAQYKVWPAPVGVHSFGYDIDSEYASEYYKLFPQPEPEFPIIK